MTTTSVDHDGRQDYQHSSLHYFAVSSVALHGLLLSGLLLLPQSPEPLPKKQLAVIEVKLLSASALNPLSGDRPSNASIAPNNSPTSSNPNHSTNNSGNNSVSNSVNNSANPNDIATTPKPKAIASNPLPPRSQPNLPNPGTTPPPKTNTPGKQPDNPTQPITSPSKPISNRSGAPVSTAPIGTNSSGSSGTTSANNSPSGTNSSSGTGSSPGAAQQTGKTSQTGTGTSSNLSQPVAPAPPRPTPPPAPKPQNINCVQGCGDRRDQLNGQRGYAIVRIEISPSGQVVSASIATSSGNSSLDSKAIAAARQMGFNPRESTTNEFRSVRINLGA